MELVAKLRSLNVYGELETVKTGDRAEALAEALAGAVVGELVAGVVLIVLILAIFFMFTGEIDWCAISP